MARKNRDYKIVSYIEEVFYFKCVEEANKNDQSLSDYLRDLIIRDLHEKEEINEADFAEVLYDNSSTKQLVEQVVAGNPTSES